MAENIKIGILGGDRRQLVMAECLSETFECAVWGFDKIYCTPDERYLRKTVRCADWESAVKCSDAVILPLPSSADGKVLSCPLIGDSESCTAVPLVGVCERMPIGSILLGGIIPGIVRSYAAEHGIVTYDYYNSEELQIKNSVPTAEGAIAECIMRMPMTVAGMRVVVCGYGRCGRTLATRLKLLGAEVFVTARSVKDLSFAKVDGCIPIPLNEYREYPAPADAVFNTVPVRIFDGDLLSKLSAETVIFELATGNAGVDLEWAEKLHIKVIPLPSLPGKTSPQSAGEIICTVVRDKLYSHFEGR